MLIVDKGRVVESAIKSSHELVEVPIGDVRAGHAEVDEILKVIDAESTTAKIAMAM